MLALSADAVPHLSVADVERVCVARGLDGHELVLRAGEDAGQLVDRARAARLRVVAIRAARITEDTASALARASQILSAPVSIAAASIELGLLDRVASAFAAHGGRLLLGHGTTLDEAVATLATIRALDARVLGTAWELQPAVMHAEEGSAVLLATREHLGLVRLHGGGPEQRAQDGRGVGPLLGELAISGYRGPIVLCPSTLDPQTLALWAAWAESRGSSGCGHAASRREHVLDMREVEPRHRLDTILGAYRSLIPGATLQLTLDHDPSCMYYTLEATEPTGSFAFQVVEDGPEVWRAQVTKR